MNKMIFLMLVTLSTSLLAKPNVVVSILPQKTFVQKIAKDMVDVSLMVKPRNSPHSYEPKPSQMIAISKADIYFSIGIEFENVWLKKFKSQNKNLQIVNISDNVTKREMQKHGHDDHNDHEGHHHEDEDMLDPHTWLSPKNVKVMAIAIYESLVKIDPANKISYEKNLNKFIKEIENTDKEIKKILKSVKPKAKFMVFHPSWGYFADAYNLTQLAVEVNGKSPKPKEMIMIIEEAKEERVQAIFAQPEFSDKSATIIAKEANIKVEKISPLNPRWSQNLINMATKIAKR